MDRQTQLDQTCQSGAGDCSARKRGAVQEHNKYYFRLGLDSRKYWILVKGATGISGPKVSRKNARSSGFSVAFFSGTKRSSLILLVANPPLAPRSKPRHVWYGRVCLSAIPRPLRIASCWLPGRSASPSRSAGPSTSPPWRE